MTTLLAVWGAILSTVLALFQIVAHWKDKGNLLVDVRIMRASNVETPHFSLFVSVFNKGRRPIRIIGFGASRKKAADTPYLMIPIMREATTLQEGEGFEENLQMFHFVEQDIESVFFRDASGKLWKPKKKVMKDLLKEAQQPEVTGYLDRVRRPTKQ